MEKTSEQLRAEALECEHRKEESFERCDTDGFLSQWANGLTAELLRRKADVKDNGGKWDFPGLFNLQGKRVRAKLIKSRFGYCWAFCDAAGRFTGKFIGDGSDKTLKAKGYIRKMETVPAEAYMAGRGHGLSGSAFVAFKRLDKGYPEDVAENTYKSIYTKTGDHKYCTEDSDLEANHFQVKCPECENTNFTNKVNVMTDKEGEVTHRVYHCRCGAEITCFND